MRLQNPFAYAVLLASYAFDRALYGSWKTVWSEGLRPSQLATNDAVFRRCSAGSLTCPRRRYGEQQRQPTPTQQGDHYGTEELRLRQPVTRTLAEKRVSEAVNGRSEVVTETTTQPHDHLTQLETHAIESAVEEFPYSVIHPCFVSEKQASNCIRGAIKSHVREENLATFGMSGVGNDALESTRARGGWQDILYARKWEGHESEPSYLPPDVAFVLLETEARPYVRSVLRRTRESETRPPSYSFQNVAEYGTSSLKYASPEEDFNVSKGLRDNTCRGGVASGEYTDMTQDSDTKNGSFLHSYSVKNLSTHTDPAEKTLEVARVTKQKTPRCTPGTQTPESQRVTYCFRESAVAGEGATPTADKASWHPETSSTLRFDAEPDEGSTSQRKTYKSHRNEVALAGGYSLIDLWSGGSQQAFNSNGRPYSQRGAVNEYSRIKVREHNNLLNHDSLVTITYQFPFHTAETQSIAFVLVALPPGYAARENGELCTTSDSGMPSLSCRVRHVGVPARDGNSEATGKKRTVFVQVSSAEHDHELPLGTHHFSVWVRNPPYRLAVGPPKNWWFVTFRFSPGHTVTKHFENGLLHEKRKCAWTSWRQETPCSASCGPGFELWTRSLLAGDDSTCGPDVMKRKCELVPCNINCQLGPWETVIDCTKSCAAKEGAGFQLSIRKVLLDQRGAGTACRELYPWNSKLQQGWSDKLSLVIRRTPCPAIYAKECSSDLGCRVERRIARTISVTYPWGSCPFPCGGVGFITSVIQVANGIPRWIGERDFPATFQAPCRADREPIVARQRCNTFACEDCSIYVEGPAHDGVARAWFFFLPSQEANIVIVTIPPGITFALTDNTTEVKYHSPKVTTEESEERAVDDKGAPQQTSDSTDVLRPSDKSQDNVEDTLPARSLPEGPTPEQNLEDILTDTDVEDKSDTWMDGGTKGALESQTTGNTLCRHMRASFGRPSRCDFRPSTRYPMYHEMVFQLDEHIVTPYSRPPDQQFEPQAENEVHRSKRPEWLVVPLRLSDGVNKETKGNFYMWLMSSQTPRDPEVFACQVKTPIYAPVKCQYTYSPVRPEDCDECNQQSSNKILMLRRFVPPKYGGTCNVPQERWQRDVVLVTATCTKGCAGTRKGAQRNKFSASPSGLTKGRSSLENSRNLRFAGASVIRSVSSLDMLREPVGNPRPSPMFED